MAMHHENHPDTDYEMATGWRCWILRGRSPGKPGQESPQTGELGFGGGMWRYDLVPSGPSQTTVTLNYDWSAVPPPVREYIHFPPFGRDHFEHSLQHLADLVA